VKKVKFILPILFFTANCGGSGQQLLTKESYKRFLRNSPQTQDKLKIGTFHGCVHVPATDWLQKKMLGFERTGETCSVTVSRNNTVDVSFLENPVSVVSTNTDQYRTDIFIGELGNDQVLIVQHHESRVVSVTQTIYDKNGNVVYGKFEEGDYIKECHLAMATFEKSIEKQNCGK